MRSLGVVLTMYQMKTPARRSTMAVKATDSPRLSPLMIARRNATTPIASRGHTVVEVNRPDRSTRYRKGKSDPTDAEMAARAVLAGVGDATPKSGEGEVEMIRMFKSTKDSAVKARTQAINQMKALVVTAPARLREHLTGLTAAALVTRSKSFRPGRMEGPTAAAKYALRSLARRYRQLGNEIKYLEAEIQRLTRTASPSPGGWLRHRTRHGGDPPHYCRE